MQITRDRLELDEFFADIYELKDGIPSFKCFVDGEWIATKDVREIKSPINNSIIGYMQLCKKDDVDKAIRAAVDAKPKMRNMAGIDRIELLQEAKELMLKHKDSFVNAIMLDAGKPRRDAESEFNASLERLELTMQEASKIFGEYIPGDWNKDTKGKFALVIREPRGVIACISPFNYPLFIGLAKIVPALLAGNTVIAKPASADPIPLILFAKTLEEAGLPKGAFNLITGDAGDISDPLIRDERIAMINFTGSTIVGREIADKAGMKHLHLELGGKGMAIVLDDADLDLAARACVEGAFKNAGQRCDAISAILVIDKVADKFVEKVLRYAEEWKYGDPREDVKIGPLIDERAARFVEELVTDAIEKGAKLLKGGRRDKNYFEPTVLDHVPLNARIAWEETFGPVATIIRISKIEDALDIGHKSNYGLDSCIFTNNFYKIWNVVKELNVGEITINDLPKHGVGYFPFGGVKYSGLGREGIGYSLKEMTTLKTIVFNLKP
ncbi:MAG: aldehyde dehydrogenase family protein [Candidatus Nitrosothermus koennekii]|nr:MAG: aldehyde dehydrogenase family protein [Candidatus Nitrosothermus koennekii]